MINVTADIVVYRIKFAAFIEWIKGIRIKVITTNSSTKNNNKQHLQLHALEMHRILINTENYSLTCNSIDVKAN